MADPYSPAVASLGRGSGLAPPGTATADALLEPADGAGAERLGAANSNEGPPAVVLATAGYDHTIRFWDVVRGLCIGTLQHNESVVPTGHPRHPYLSFWW